MYFRADSSRSRKSLRCWEGGREEGREGEREERGRGEGEVRV